MNQEERAPFILVVDDEEAIRTMLHYTFTKQGFEVSTAQNGDEALAIVKKTEKQPDLIILDWMLPGLSGIDVCTILRTKPNTKNIPIIMLTAKGEEFDKIKGWESGIDDYIVKPFSPSDLVGRVRARLRGRNRAAFVRQVLQYKDLKLDTASRRVTKGNNTFKLGPTESKVLECLMKAPTRVLTRKDIMYDVWGGDEQVAPRTIDVYINRLRAALNSNEKEDCIQTIRVAGYCVGGPGAGTGKSE
ncbi:MAG: response regulator [Rickettsiales endosymbiont of Dermacentor nuttalli]